MDTERQLLRVPFECYSRDFRLSQKKIEKEIGRIVDEIAAVDASAAASHEVDAKLAEWEAALVALQAEHAATVKAESRFGQLLAKRLQHLAYGYGHGGGEVPTTFQRARVNRLMINHLLLNGFVESARQLAKVEGLEDLVDADVFEELHKIGDELVRHNVEPALAWAATNASKLRRLESSLVLQLRRFQFLELVRTGRKQRALDHASEHFGSAAASAAGSDESKQSDAHNALMQLQQDMALLAFPDPEHCGVPAYERLFEHGRWEELRKLFFKEAGRALGFSAEISQLDLVVQAGLVALKLPSCKPRPVPPVDLALPYGPPAKQRVEEASCPACNPVLAAVAAKLPSCRRTKSRLVCGLSHTVMEGDNVPLSLPNGFVYGRTALQQMAADHHGEVLCPRTGQKFDLAQAERAYVG